MWIIRESHSSAGMRHLLKASESIDFKRGLKTLDGSRTRDHMLGGGYTGEGATDGTRAIGIFMDISICKTRISVEEP